MYHCIFIPGILLIFRGIYTLLVVRRMWLLLHCLLFGYSPIRTHINMCVEKYIFYCLSKLKKQGTVREHVFIHSALVCSTMIQVLHDSIHYWSSLLKLCCFI